MRRKHIVSGVVLVSAGALLAITFVGSQPGGSVRATPRHNASALLDAERVLLERCLKSRGFPSVDHQTVRELPRERQREFDHALNGPANAKSVSVRLATGYTVSRSTSGCRYEAQRKLYDDFARWFRVSTIVNNIPAEANKKASGDPRFAEAKTAWSSCMKHAGYSAREQLELRAKPPSKAAKRTEVSCARSSGLSVITERYTAQITREHRAQINEYRDLQQAALRKAEELHLLP